MAGLNYGKKSAGVLLAVKNNTDHALRYAYHSVAQGQIRFVHANDNPNYGFMNKAVGFRQLETSSNQDHKDQATWKENEILIKSKTGAALCVTFGGQEVAQNEFNNEGRSAGCIAFNIGEEGSLLIVSYSTPAAALVRYHQDTWGAEGGTGDALLRLTTIRGGIQGPLCGSFKAETKGEMHTDNFTTNSVPHVFLANTPGNKNDAGKHDYGWGYPSFCIFATIELSST